MLANNELQSLVKYLFNINYPLLTANNRITAHLCIHRIATINRQNANNVFSYLAKDLQPFLQKFRETLSVVVSSAQFSIMTPGWDVV